MSRANEAVKATMKHFGLREQDIIPPTPYDYESEIQIKLSESECPILLDVIYSEVDPRENDPDFGDLYHPMTTKNFYFRWM